MILTCPQCATRYQVDGAKFPAAGRNVRCAKCGNVWHQLGPVPEPDPEAEIMVEEPAPRTAPEPVAVQPRVAAFAPVAVTVASEAEPVRARTSWLGRVGLVFGWLLLIGLVLVIGWAAVNFRNTVATWVPQTRPLYSVAGLAVAPRGLDFDRVTYHLETEGKLSVLVVTGQIVNRSTHELIVPQLELTLLDADRHKLTHWTYVAPVLTLKAGETANIHARFSDPPHDARNLEVRFVRAGE